MAKNSDRAGGTGRSLLLPLGITLLAIGATLPYLVLPYGVDQGTFHYFSMAWNQGQIPYRDIFDDKPPFIFVLYRVIDQLFDNSPVTFEHLN